MSDAPKRIPVQGVHHVTIVGSNRESSIDFWEGLLGMPFVFEQPNLSVPEESHLYFDPGDGRLITVFTREGRADDAERTSEAPGHVHHLAFRVSRATYTQVAARLEARGITFRQFDRGFMDSTYFRDPNGALVELACYKFEAPEGIREVEVLARAHALRVAAGAHHIEDEHLADAIEALQTERTPSLSREADA